MFILSESLEGRSINKGVYTLRGFSNGSYAGWSWGYFYGDIGGGVIGYYVSF